MIHFEDAVAHLFAEVEGLENFDAELHQLVQEIVGGTDVEREIRVGHGGRIGVRMQRYANRAKYKGKTPFFLLFPSNEL